MNEEDKKMLMKLRKRMVNYQKSLENKYKKRE
jgi:hypothetical protein